MKLLEQLINELGGDETQSFTVIPAFGGYFKSIKSVCEFSPERIVLRQKRRSIVIVGNGLEVGKYFEGDVFVKGGIKSVEIE